MENLLTPELLRRLAWNPPQPIDSHSIAAGLQNLGARPWQVALTAQEIARSFVEAGQEVAKSSDEES